MDYDVFLRQFRFRLQSLEVVLYVCSFSSDARSKFCKQQRNCPKQQFFGCLQNYRSGNIDVIAYSTISKDCSLKQNQHNTKKKQVHENERVPLQKLVSTHCEPHSTVCTRVVHTGGKSTKNMPRRYLRSETNHHRVSRAVLFSSWQCSRDVDIVLNYSRTSGSVWFYI